MLLLGWSFSEDVQCVVWWRMETVRPCEPGWKLQVIFRVWFAPRTVPDQKFKPRHAAMSSKATQGLCFCHETWERESFDKARGWQVHSVSLLDDMQ